MDTMESIYYYMVIAWYCCYIYFICYLHVHNSISYRSEYNKEYCESIPNLLNPGSLSMLMYKKITPETLTAAIFILIKKNILEVERRDNDYILSLAHPEHSTFDIGNSQKYILDFLIDIMNEQKEVSLTRIYNYCNGSSGSSNFLLNYQIWKKLILKESCRQKFYEDKLDYSKVKLFKNIGLILFLLAFILHTNLVIGYFILIPSLFLPLYFYKIYKRTVEANEEYYKWLAFRNYLANISQFSYDEKDIDKYLIYATMLKVNEEFRLQNANNFDADFVSKLNNAVKRCVKRANLYGSRSIVKFGNKD